MVLFDSLHLSMRFVFLLVIFAFVQFVWRRLQNELTIKLNTIFCTGTTGSRLQSERGRTPAIPTAFSIPNLATND